MLMEATNGLIGYFGHHKCATQWMKGLVRGIGPVVGRTVQRYFNAREFDRDLNSIPDRESTLVCYTNADFRFVKRAEGLRGWHMVRDPRDIVVSSYFSHLYSHPTSVFSGPDAASQQRDLPELEQHRQTLQSLPKAEGLMLEMEARATQFRIMMRWDYERENLLEMRMEEVTADPLSALREITAFTGLYGVNGLDDEKLSEIVAANDFRVYTGGRAPGEEDVTSHYRKGVPGDWKLHFEP
jgi:hypothetical protein